MVPIEVPPGGAAFHHGLCFHGSPPNERPDADRRAIISHMVSTDTTLASDASATRSTRATCGLACSRWTRSTSRSCGARTATARPSSKATSPRRPDVSPSSRERSRSAARTWRRRRCSGRRPTARATATSRRRRRPWPTRSASSCAGSSASGPTSPARSPTASATASGAGRRSRPSASSASSTRAPTPSSTRRSSCARATRWRPSATCAGRRVGAIAGSTNLALAETFPEVECVPFDGVSDDVFGDMLRALQDGDVDAVVDDDVAFIGIERTHPGLRVAFTVATRNPWGCALRLGDDDLKRDARRGHRAGRPARRLALLAAVAALPAVGVRARRRSSRAAGCAARSGAWSGRAPCRSPGTPRRRSRPCC